MRSPSPGKCRRSSRSWATTRLPRRKRQPNGRCWLGPPWGSARRFTPSRTGCRGGSWRCGNGACRSETANLATVQPAPAKLRRRQFDASRKICSQPDPLSRASDAGSRLAPIRGGRAALPVGKIGAKGCEIPQGGPPPGSEFGAGPATRSADLGPWGPESARAQAGRAPQARWGPRPP